jgi:hypothetical protein
MMKGTVTSLRGASTTKPAKRRTRKKKERTWLKMKKRTRSTMMKSHRSRIMIPLHFRSRKISKMSK